MTDEEFDKLMSSALRTTTLYIDNGGFAERVVEALPRRRSLGALRIVILLGAWAAALGIVALLIPNSFQLAISAIADVIKSPVYSQVP